MQNTISAFQSILQTLKVIVDFGIIWILVYYILRIVRNNSRTVQIFKGVILVIVMRFIVTQMNLTTTATILDFILINGILVFVIIFQPEIRSMLERLGKTSVFSAINTLSGNQKEKLIDELVSATRSLSQSKTGALITLEQGHSLNDYVKTGKALNSLVTSELLTSIFVTSTPLHDGAVIIQGDRIAAASAYFPPTSQDLPTRYGARHRAAIGISEVTDSITIVVSEETGTISVAENGKLKEMDVTSLREYLNSIIQNVEKEVSQAVATKRARKLDFSRLNIDPIKIEKVDSDDVVIKGSKDPSKQSKFMKIFGVKPKASEDVESSEKSKDSDKEDKEESKSDSKATKTSEETIKRIFKKKKVDEDVQGHEIDFDSANKEKSEETSQEVKEEVESLEENTKENDNSNKDEKQTEVEEVPTDEAKEDDVETSKEVGGDEHDSETK